MGAECDALRAPFVMTELLRQPEYVHVLANPVITHVLPVATLALLVSLALRNKVAVCTSLVLVLIGAAAVWPTVHYGQAGYDRVLEMADLTGGEWLDIHMHRAESWQWLFYATAVVALAALLVPLKWPKSTTTLTLVTLALALGASGVGAYIAYPAGKIRHREFRDGPPPPAELQKAREHEHNHETGNGGEHEH